MCIRDSKWDNQLIPIEEITSLTHLKGFVLKPEFSKKTRGQQFFFVNNRFIKSPFLHHAVNNAFEGLLRSGYHPGYFLYLSLDPKTIDINIHPTKTEIKFEEEQSIYAILKSAIKHSLGIFQVMPSLDFEQNKDLALPYDFTEKTPLMPSIDVDSSFNPFKDKISTNSKRNSNEREGLLTDLNLDEENIAKLSNKGIKNKDDLAELSIDELQDIIDITENDASAMIMKAREHWFN